MSYTNKQVQNFNDEMQMEFKEKNGGRFNLFSPLSQFVTWLKTQIPIGTGVVETIVAGDGITVDNTDPANPIVTAEASGIDGTGTANILSKFTDANSIGDSSITDSGTLVSTAIPIKGSRLIAGTDMDANYQLNVDGISLLNGNVNLNETVNRRIEFGSGLAAIQIEATGNGRIVGFRRSQTWRFTDNNDVEMALIDSTGIYHAGDKIATEDWVATQITGASDTFTSDDGKTITVVNGLVTSIV